jgi:hypothetical protein
MAYVIYDTRSTMQMGPTEHGNPHSLYAKTYKTRGAALNTMTKWNNRQIEIDRTMGPGPYGVADLDHYRNRVIRMVTKTNLLSGKEYQEASNTPGFCSPSSEAYWSM